MTEPVAYINVEKRALEWAKLTRWETPTTVKMDKIPLYTAPSKKEWAELTEDDAIDLLPNVGYEYEVDVEVILSFAKAIEAKLKEKNCG